MFSKSINKNLEEKYFFTNNNAAKTVQGNYFHTTIFNNSGTEFNDTFAVLNLQKQIEKLGAKLYYTGGINDVAKKMINQNKPAYINDIYDPMPYRYKQFLLKTKEANYWFEIIHGLNANQIDLTVMREEINPY